MFSNLHLPLQFAHYDVSLTFEIIASLNEQTERSITANTRRYQKIGPKSEEYEISAEDNLFHVVDYYMGLDSGSVDLEEMFTTYYPSVMRRSVFLTLYGMLEHDFEKLCNGFTKVHNAPKALSDLRGSGFERCNHYARKFIDMPTSIHYADVKRVTRLRNTCAHNDARFIGNDGQPIVAVEELMRNHHKVFSRDGEQVNFKVGSLKAMTRILKSYFNDVEKALRNHKAPDPFIAFRK